MALASGNTGLRGILLTAKMNRCGAGTTLFHADRKNCYEEKLYSCCDADYFSFRLQEA